MRPSNMPLLVSSDHRWWGEVLQRVGRLVLHVKEGMRVERCKEEE